MSSLIVEVCRVDQVDPHPNADKLAIATIKGWQTCIVRNPETGKNQFEEGDSCVYIPPDSVIPVPLADKLGVMKYLSPVKDETDQVIGGRVRVSRLRSQPSYGLILKPDDPSWPVGMDVAAIYGITKWEPPLDCTDGDAEHEHPAFHRYFTLENINNFPDLIPEGEEVEFPEKVHGKNCRVGYIRDQGPDGHPTFVYMAGSHDVRRKEFQVQRKKKVNPETGEEVTYEVTKKSQFWEALDKPGVRDLLFDVSDGMHNVVVFGEIYGSGVQDMAYGFHNGQWGFRVFDITVDGVYLDCDTKWAYCHKHGVETVPVLYRGPFSHAKVKEFVGGPTNVCDPANAGSFKEREGIVIVTTREQSKATEKKFFDRMALKAINFKYLERKGGTEFH